MKISSTEMLEALNRSGYFLESRMLEILAKREYQNFPNQTYPDLITGKSREIDILASSPRLTKTIKLNHSLTFEYVHELVIECVNNSQPVAFFKRPDKNPYTIFGKFFYHNTEREMVEPTTSESAFHTFHMFTTTSKEFHYNLMAKNTQYCSFSPKKINSKEWMASHPDALHDTFNKLNDYCEHSIKKTEEWINSSWYKNQVYTKFLFPVLVLQNDLVEVSEIDGKVNVENKNHIIFEFSKYSENRHSILIDVITEEYLPEYIKLVQNDLLKLRREVMEVYNGNEIVAEKK